MSNFSKMNIPGLVKLPVLLAISFGLISCGLPIESGNQRSATVAESSDTIIVKRQRRLNKSYEVGFYSKSYSYYWLAGNDTLDFTLNAGERKKDSTMVISIHHDDPIWFSEVLRKFSECLPLMRNDFDLTKLDAICFKSPTYYFGLAKELSMAYQQQFGRKYISDERLNQFLLKSGLNQKLTSLLQPLHKKATYYSIEKIFLIDKKDYREYAPDANLAGYPEIIIGGMNLYVHLENTGS